MAELRLVVTGLAYVLAMVLSGLLGRRERIGIVVLGLLSFAWLTLDRLFEPAHPLWKLNSHHALTLPDFISFAGLVATAALWHADRSRRRAAQAQPSDRPSTSSVSTTSDR